MAEVKLQPGWLARDMAKASATVEKWIKSGRVLTPEAIAEIRRKVSASQ